MLINMWFKSTLIQEDPVRKYGNVKIQHPVILIQKSNSLILKITKKLLWKGKQLSGGFIGLNHC